MGRVQRIPERSILSLVHVPTYPWPKTRPSPEQWNRRNRGASSQFRRSADYTTDTSDARLSHCLSRGPPPTFPFIRQRRTLHRSAIGTFTSHEPTPVSRGTDIANTISPSQPAANWNRNTAKEAPNTKNGVFGNYNSRRSSPWGRRSPSFTGSRSMCGDFIIVQA